MHKLHPDASLRDAVDVAELHATLIDMVRTWFATRAEVLPTPYGRILRDLEHPLVYDANLAWVDRVPEGGPIAVLADLDRAFSGTDVRHRFVFFADAQEAYDHQEAFASAGFRPQAELVMAKVGLPACIVNPDVVVKEVPPDAGNEDFRRVQLAVSAESGYAQEESRQVYEVERAKGTALGERAYVGYLRGKVAATVSVWPRGNFALIGSVATLPEFRMQGVGRTMVFDACREAINLRCEYSLLTTDLFDTPRAMYKTLGFEPVGELRGFLRPPA